jgi:hypothetical protein
MSLRPGWSRVPRVSVLQDNAGNGQPPAGQGRFAELHTGPAQVVTTITVITAGRIVQGTTGIDSSTAITAAGAGAGADSGAGAGAGAGSGATTAATAAAPAATGGEKRKACP